ncbi:hypothetical protein MAFF211271_32700 (plasmid) [Ralstonia syzygii subsp. indonesiensis]|nr:hypothetical protein MAFF211271_32700 [Ralstonia pseudosolanacearum]
MADAGRMEGSGDWADVIEVEQPKQQCRECSGIERARRTRDAAATSGARPGKPQAAPRVGMAASSSAAAVRGRLCIRRGAPEPKVWLAV